MNINDLREKQVGFENNWINISTNRSNVEYLRQQFVRQFPIHKIRSLTLNDYVLGRLHIDKSESFCYWLEKKLNDLGRISGSPAWQYGVYYGEYQKDGVKQFRFMKKWGDSLNEAFTAVKKAISDLLEAGSKENIDQIALNPIANKLKGKILSTYFPNRYLNIFADEYLTDALVYFNLDTDNRDMSAIEKQELILGFKNKDRVMSKWSVDKFAVFIVDEMRRNFYLSEKLDPELKDYADPRFPPLNEVTIKMVHSPISGSPNPSTNKHSRKGTFEKKARLLKKLGTRAELLVMHYEIKNFKSIGRWELSSKVRHIAKDDDTAGYDILSYNLDGSQKYIEVKATKFKPGKAQFFISASEKKFAENCSCYHIYIVHGVTTVNPTIWDIRNPFNPPNTKVAMIPTVFSIAVE